jgi:hypothetical protein
MIHPEDAAEFLLEYAAAPLAAPGTADAVTPTTALLKSRLPDIADRLRSMGYGGYDAAHRTADMELLTAHAAGLGHQVLGTAAAAAKRAAGPETTDPASVIRKLEEIAELIRERR